MRVIYAVDALVALAFAEGALAAIALAIAFASASEWLTIALSSIFSFAFAWLGVLSSALARTLSCTVALALAVGACLAPGLSAMPGGVGHMRWGWPLP